MQTDGTLKPHSKILDGIAGSFVEGLNGTLKLRRKIHSRGTTTTATVNEALRKGRRPAPSQQRRKASHLSTQHVRLWYLLLETPNVKKPLNLMLGETFTSYCDYPEDRALRD